MGGHQEQTGGIDHTNMARFYCGIASAVLVCRPANCGAGLLVVMNYVVVSTEGRSDIT